MVVTTTTQTKVASRLPQGLRLDSYLRYQRQPRRFWRLCLHYHPRPDQIFRTWGTDSLPLWLPPSWLVRVPGTSPPPQPTTTITLTRTTCVRCECSRQRFRFCFSPLAHRIVTCTPSGSTLPLECCTTSVRELAPRLILLR